MDIRESSPKTPLYQDLYNKLREKIVTGFYEVGEKLPSEKDIIEEYGVSRITSKHALDQLVSEGYIHRQAGRGTFVKSRTGIKPAVRPPRITGLIGVIMEQLSPGFGGDILVGIEQILSAAGHTMALKFSHGDIQREAECIRELMEAGAQGIILMCAYNEIYSPEVMRLSLDGFPMVFIDRRLKGLPVPYVGTDHYACTREMTEALLQEGHTELALAMFEAPHHTTSAEERVEGFTQCCFEHNLPCGNRRIFLRRERTQEAWDENILRIRAFLAENPGTTALMALSVRVAVLLMHAAQGTAVQTVASFDGPANSFQVPCRLIYMEQDQLSIGRSAAECLTQLMDGLPTDAQILIPSRFHN